MLVCLHTCICVHLVLRASRRFPYRVCTAMKAKNNNFPPFFPKSQDKRDCLHLISSMAFRRHVKWLSEQTGGHTGSFI